MSVVSCSSRSPLSNVRCVCSTVELNTQIQPSATKHMSSMSSDLSGSQIQPRMSFGAVVASELESDIRSKA